MIDQEGKDCHGCPYLKKINDYYCTGDKHIFTFVCAINEYGLSATCPEEEEEGE